MSLRLMLALVAAAAAIHAQTGVLAGVVKETGSDAPLANVSVWAGGDQTTTDAMGRFRFAALTPGTKRIYVADKEHGGSASASVVVRAGEEATLEIRLKLGGSISGRVLDSARRPIAGAAVLLLQRWTQFGEIVYTPAQTVATNERGEYHFEAVAAERRFLVLAKERLSATASEEAPPFEQREQVLTPALYGDSPDVRGAQTVTLASREQRTGVDIRLAETPGYCVEGTVDTEAKEVFVSLTERLPLAAGLTFRPATVRAGAEGAFRACGLHPGEYGLLATSRPPGNALADRMSGWAAIAIGSGSALVLDKDVRGLRLVDRAPTPVEGDAVYDPPPREKTGAISISVTRYVAGDDYADSTEKPTAGGSLSGMIGSGRGTAVPGSVSLGRLRAGEWLVRVSKLAPGCYLKSATYGQQNLLRGFLRVGDDGGTGRVQLSIACDGGSLTARVTDSDGKPVSNAILYLFDPDARAPGEMVLSLHRAPITDGWSAPIAALRPGKYLALATTIDAGSEGSADDLEALWSLKGEAKPVEVGPGAMAQVSIKYSSR